MNLIFFCVCIIHVFIWIYVVFAFVNKTASYYNLFYIIPIIYILHMLPFHILGKIKENIYKNKYKLKNENDKSFKILLFPTIHNWLKNIFKNSFFNPFSPQGMLILGAITSAWRLKNNFIIDL